MYLKIKLNGKVIAKVNIPIDDILEFAEIDNEDFADYDYLAKEDIVHEWFMDNLESDLIENEELSEEVVKEASNSLKNWADNCG